MCKTKMRNVYYKLLIDNNVARNISKLCCKINILKRCFNKWYPYGIVKSEMVIVDDVFPSKYSLFRYIEYIEYLNHFENLVIVCTGKSINFIEKRSVEDIVDDFFAEYPQFKNRIVIDKEEKMIIDADVVYINFYNNLDAFYKRNLNNSPFIVNLYPGGGLQFFNEKIDRRMKKYLQSPLCCKVITTQMPVKNYLIDNGICHQEKIENIFGVVVDSNKLDINNKKWFGFDKDRFDICFVAYKYMKNGHDKGYDMFIHVAKKICSMKDNVFFHVVGNFSSDDMDISDIKDHITFYGAHNKEWFDDFYIDKDVIISPNIPFVLSKGAFDGFPTGAVIEAGSHAVAMFATDELNMNQDYFINNKELVIIKHDVDDIVNKVLYFYENYNELRKLSTSGMNKIKTIYSVDYQIKPRIKILEHAIGAKS